MAQIVPCEDSEDEEFLKQTQLGRSKGNIVISAGYGCTVLTLLTCMTILLFFICGGMVWSYLFMSSTNTMTAVSNGSGSQPANYGIPVIPGRKKKDEEGNTLEVLLDHDPDAAVLTQDEARLLTDWFNLYDANDDGLWDLAEFEVFIDEVLEPEERFDAIDLDKDSVLSFKEIYLFLSKFDESSIFECDESDRFIHDALGHKSDERDSLYYEYMAQLWLYELDKLKVGSISKANYVKYVEDEEWEYHNHDADSHVDLSEFKDRFFGSLFFKTWQKSMSLVGDDKAFQPIRDEFLTGDLVAQLSELELSTNAHEFDSVIEKYMNGQTYSVKTDQHSPTQSLLYSFPLAAISNSMSSKRRLGVCWNGKSWHWKCGCLCDANCFDESGIVNVLADGSVETRLLKDVFAGDYVFDGAGYTKVIAVEKGGNVKLEMIQLYFSYDSAITLTADHLLYNEQNEMIPAGDVQIGDKLLNDLVVTDVEYNLYKTPSTPLTMSGKISVGVTASCYIISPQFAGSAHKLLMPFRFLSENLSEYYTAQVLESIIADFLVAYNLSPAIWNYCGYLHPFVNVLIAVVMVPIFLMRSIVIYFFSQLSVLEPMVSFMSL